MTDVTDGDAVATDEEAAPEPEVTLYVEARHEPSEFHGTATAEDIAHFAVSLALSVRFADGDGDGLAQREAIAKEVTDSFIGGLGDGRFVLVRIDAGGGVAERDVLDPPITGDPRPDLAEWLEEAKAEIETAAGFDVPFYQSQAAERDATNIENVSAFELQLTAARWPAPAAQNAGLMTAVKVEGDLHDIDDALPAACIVYLPAGMEAGDVAFVSSQEDVIQLTIPWTGEQTISARCARLRIGDLEETFNVDGSCDLPPDPQALAALLGRIAERAPVEMWGGPLLQSLLQPKDERLGVVTDEALGIRRLWLARAAVLCAFDLPILGLLNGRRIGEPGPDTPPRFRRAALPSLAVACIARKVEALGHAVDLDDDALLDLLQEKLAVGADGQTLFERALDRFKLTDVKVWPETAAAWNGTLEHDPATWSDRAAALTGELTQLTRRLAEDKEIEAWIDKEIKTALGLEALDGAETTELPPDLKEAVHGVEGVSDYDLLKAFLAGLDAFGAMLSGEVDANEIIRQDVGAAVTDILLRTRTDMSPASDANGSLKSLFLEAHPLLRRHHRPEGVGALDGLLDLLPVGDLPEGEWPSDDTEVEEVADAPESSATIGDVLAGTWAAAAGDIVTRPEDGPRFRPDSAPQALQLPFVFVPNSDPQAVSTQISGVGYLIRAEDGPVAHLNLLGMTLASSETVTTVDPALPMSGGAASDPVLPFTGDPLSSPNRESPVVTGSGGPALDPAKLRPFSLDDATYRESDGTPVYEQVPTLAYGKSYEVAAYWVPPSGTLHPSMRDDAAHPFTPATVGRLEDFFGEGTPKVTYRRRTAIGEMKLSRLDGGKVRADLLPMRLGDIPDDVQSLALEDPRFLVVTDGRRRDLYRRADGTGMLARGATAVLERIDLPAGATLIVEAMDGREPKAEERFDAEDVAGGGIVVSLPEDDMAGPYWLRLRAEGAAVSFADPAAGAEREPAAPAPAPVLLLAPEVQGWTIAEGSRIAVDLPRVSYADFERWARNTQLMERAAGAGAEKLARCIRQTRAVLVATQSDRLDEIDRLPDPAVVEVRIGAGVTHRTTEAGADAVVVDPAVIDDVQPYNGLVLNDLENPEEGETRGPLALAKDNLDKLATAGSLVVAVNPAVNEDDAPDEAARVTCPPGRVTRLWISPGIEARHFGAAVSEHLRDLVVGESDDGSIAYFDGPKISVEVARQVEGENSDDPNDHDVLAEALVADVPDNARSYRLSADLRNAGPRAALFATSTLSTQRWRPTGLPITRFIDPRGLQANASRPVVEIGPNVDNLAEFETDAFRTRFDGDAERRRVRLDGARAKTVLDTVDWPDRSATYFRHKLRLTSRYAALWRGDGQSVAQPDWSLRLAILADPLRSAVTRPQIRTYLPLLTRASDRLLESADGAPPLVCYLSEPPYAQLGLAERIDAEIETTQIYGFEERPDEPVGNEAEAVERGAEAVEEVAESKIPDPRKPPPILALSELRKELGVDNLLGLFRVGAKRSRSATLSTTGVIGLHFDTAEASAPAFANSMIRIDLDVPDAPGDTPEARMRDLEEVFVKVTLTRRASAAWSIGSVAPGDAKRGQNRASRAPLSDASDHWIFKPDAEAAGLLFKLPAGEDESEIVAASDDGITVLGGSLFPVAKPADYAGKPFEIWGGEWKALLLSSQGDGRFRLEVFAEGSAGDMRAVAAVSFRSDAALAMVAASGRALPRVEPTRVSEPTVARWVRTARDMSVLTVAGTRSRVPVAALSGRVEDKTVRLSRAVEAQTPLAIVPPAAPDGVTRYLHRRLVQVLLWPTPEIGHKRLTGRPSEPPGTGMVALCGGDGAADHRDTGGATALQIAEIEIPAQPIRNRDAAIGGDAFGRAWFDLKAIGAELPETWTCRFYLRGGSGPIETESDPVFAIGLHVAGDETPKQSLEVAWSDLAGDTEKTRLAWLELVVRLVRPPAGDAESVALDVEAIWVDDRGRRHRRTVAWAVTDADEEALFSTVTALTFAFSTRNDAVTWADVSMLHTKRKLDDIGPDGFDFDWIFGLPEDVDPSVSLAVRPQRLAAVREAQVGLRGSTEAIPIASD